MGKVRVATIGDEAAEEKQREAAKKRAEAKKVAAKQKLSGDHETESRETPSADATNVVESESKPEKKKMKIKSSKATHSQNYLTVSEKVDKNKNYTLKEALSLLPELKRAKFDETVELHINTTEQGISGSITLPHGTGKQTRVAIATDETIAQVEKGQIDFDILVAEPQMMPKLAKVARILGPRGLMPNPKNGTVTPKPEEVAKKYEGGQMNFKTEAKAPILHVTVGKVSFGEDKLGDNIKAFVQTVTPQKIRNVTVKSTMSPGIKLDLASI